MKQPKPIIHGRDHSHGGADVVLIAWEALGSTTMMAALEAEPPVGQPETAADKADTDT